MFLTRHFKKHKITLVFFSYSLVKCEKPEAESYRKYPELPKYDIRPPSRYPPPHTVIRHLDILIHMKEEDPILKRKF